MRALGLLLAFIIACGACAAADPLDDAIVPAAGTSATNPAPADEYFGRLKMSILGIRNHLNAVAREIESDPSRGQAAVDSLTLTEESLKEWEQKYPRDPWLARTVYMLVHVYAKMPRDVGHAHAVRTLSWLLAKYPGSEFAQTALSEVNAASGDSPAAPQR